MSLQVERKARTLLVRLNRPARGNSLDPATLLALHEAVLGAQTDARVRVVVLTGAGDKDFCTGIDVTAARDLSPEARTNLAAVAGDVATLLFHGKPALVAINGRSMGMGVVFAAAADYSLAVEHARFQMPEVNVGIFPGASCVAIMARACGVAWAKRLLMTGEPLGIDEAVQARVVEEVVSRDALEPRRKALTRVFSRKNPALLKAIKMACSHALDLSYPDVLALETQLADWYAWPDPARQFQELVDQYAVEMPLTGNPEALARAAGIESMPVGEQVKPKK